MIVPEKCWEPATRRKNNTILNYGGDPPSKYHAIEGVAPPGSFRPAAITVAMDDTESSGHVELNKCTLCGDCATGCNFGAKISLDLNLLVSAQQAGAHLYSGATVLTVEQDGANWIANCVYTNAALRARDGGSSRYALDVLFSPQERWVRVDSLAFARRGIAGGGPNWANAVRPMATCW